MLLPRICSLLRCCCASPFLSLALTGYSSNLALTIWIFLLLQALWVLLPQAEGCRGRRAEACAAMPPEERFTAALRSAQGALERLRCVSG